MDTVKKYLGGRLRREGRLGGKGQDERGIIGQEVFMPPFFPALLPSSRPPILGMEGERKMRGMDMVLRWKCNEGVKPQ